MLGALVAWPLPAALLDWQPGLASTEPWRAFSAAFVHWSTQHLAANLGAAALLLALGWAARLPRAAALAWLAAWPLTHLGLLLKPELAHYGGLSGVLHAALAVAASWLLVRSRGARRAIGAALALGLVVKVMAERPFGEPLRQAAGWDIALAPVAHASGAIAGFACATAVLLAQHNRRR